jgi:hypothetical protein
MLDKGAFFIAPLDRRRVPPPKRAAETDRTGKEHGRATDCANPLDFQFSFCSFGERVLWFGRVRTNLPQPRIENRAGGCSTQSIRVDPVIAHTFDWNAELETAKRRVVEVRAYLIALRDRGVARGTFQNNQHGIQFFYRYTLDREWQLFSKKRFVRRGRSACRSRSRTSRSVACFAA